MEKPRPLRHQAGGTRHARGPLAVLALCLAAIAAASPYTPSRDDEVLAVVPAGAAHTSVDVRRYAAERLDVALPLAQFYISQARDTGDLRFLGYAQAILMPWLAHSPALPAVMVLDATILQSRHLFGAALDELDRALRLNPQDPQAWLTRATVLRVLGRYGEASGSCSHLTSIDAATAQLCEQSIEAVTGKLSNAYIAMQGISMESLSNQALAWRCSELGEMAVSLGARPSAAQWFQRALQLAPQDTYTRAAYADLLLDEERPGEVLRILQGYESMEPLLLRIAIAQQRMHDRQAVVSRALLANAFEVEARRGESVHGREQARFLLDVMGDADGALQAADRNWHVQREPADALIFLRAARAAHHPERAAPVLDFLRARATEDVRLQPFLGAA
jgi:tetratricopeptide (TPR) repeat protein